MTQSPESEPLTHPDESEVEDEAADSETATNVLPVYDITAYGADYPVDALVQRLKEEDISIPQWQRGFVWTRRQCSRFIESLLLGLPVPGIFLYEEASTQRLVVLDGQQRLRTLLAFYLDDLEGRSFSLPEYDPDKYQTIHPDFAGKAFADLSPEDRRRLNNTILHATIVKQNFPSDPNEITSIYHIFERINTSSVKLSPQEIRTAVFGGALDRLLRQLTSETAWRELYKFPSRRLKDQELVLRYIALLNKSGEYTRPMTEFLNLFMANHRSLEGLDDQKLSLEFRHCVELLTRTVGDRVFRPKHAINAAVFEAVMVGLTRRLKQGRIDDEEALRQAYWDLMEDEAFQFAYQSATADDANVRNRLALATAAFEKVG